MQGGRHPFFNFGGPFGSFGGTNGFGSSGFAGFGPFGGTRSLMSTILGGHDPFDDPFFASPFGSVFGPNFSSPFGFAHPEIPGFVGHGPSPPHRLRGPVIEELSPDDDGGSKDAVRNMPERADQEPLPSRRLKGPIIEELSSDDDEQGKEEDKSMSENSRKHKRPMKKPLVEHPNDGTPEKKKKYGSRAINTNPLNQLQSQPQSQSHSFSFHSSTVSYGGSNGTYYTSSTTRRSGSDGLMFEEHKEADSSTRQATHKVTRGIHDKGHSVTRKLTSSGLVDTMQTLHNLDEDELVHFNKTWNGNVREHHSLHQGQGSQDTIPQLTHNVGWALPSTERSHVLETMSSAGNKQHTTKGAHEPHHATGSSGLRRGFPKPRSQHQG